MGKPLSRPDCLRRNNPTCLGKSEEDDMYIEDCYIPQRSIYDTMRINEQIDLGSKPSRGFADHTHSVSQRAVETSTLSSNGTPTTSSVFEIRTSSESKKLDERVIFDALKLSSDVIRSSGPPKRRPHVERKENINRRSWKAFLPPNFPDFTANEPAGSANLNKEKRHSSHFPVEIPNLFPEKELTTVKSALENEKKSTFQQGAESKLKGAAVLSQSSESECAPLLEYKDVPVMLRHLPENHACISATWPRAFRAKGTLEDASFMHRRAYEIAQERKTAYATSMECGGILDLSTTKLDTDIYNVQEIMAEFEEQGYDMEFKSHVNPGTEEQCKNEKMFFDLEFLSEESALHQLDAIIQESAEGDMDSLLQFEQEEQRLIENRLIEDSEESALQQLDAAIMKVTEEDADSLLRFEEEQVLIDDKEPSQKSTFQQFDAVMETTKGDTDSLLQFEEEERNLFEDGEVFNEQSAFQQLDAEIFEGTEAGTESLLQFEEEQNLFKGREVFNEQSTLQLDSEILESTKGDADSLLQFEEEERCLNEDREVLDEESALRQLDAVILESTEDDANSLLSFEADENQLLDDDKVMESDMSKGAKENLIAIQKLSSTVGENSAELDGKSHSNKSIEGMTATEQKSTNTDWKSNINQKEKPAYTFESEVQKADEYFDTAGQEEGDVYQKEITAVSKEGCNVKFSHGLWKDILVGSEEARVNSEENSNCDKEVTVVFEERATGSGSIALTKECGIHNAVIKKDGQKKSVELEEYETTIHCPTDSSIPSNINFDCCAQEVGILPNVQETKKVWGNSMQLNELDIIEYPSTNSTVTSHLDLSYCALEMAMLSNEEEAKDVQAAFVQLGECEMAVEPLTINSPLESSEELSNYNQEVSIIPCVLDVGCIVEKFPGDYNGEEQCLNSEKENRNCIEFEVQKIDFQFEFSNLELEPEATEIQLLHTGCTDIWFNEQKGLIDLDETKWSESLDAVAPMDVHSSEQQFESDPPEIDFESDLMVQNSNCSSEVLLFDMHTEQLLEAIRFLFQSNDEVDINEANVTTQATAAGSREMDLKANVWENLSGSCLEDDFIEAGMLEYLFELKSPEESNDTNPRELTLEPGSLNIILDTEAEEFTVEPNEVDFSILSEELDADIETFQKVQVDPIQYKLQQANGVGQGLIQSAVKNANTQGLEHDLDEMNTRWNTLNKKVAERISQLQEALLHRGKFQDALEPLLSWLTDTEELIANQKPPSAEYKVVKAQIQEQKLLQRLLDDRRSTVEIIKAEGERIAESAETDEKVKIQKQLQSLGERWGGLLSKAAARQRQLEDILVIAKQFHETVEPLNEWLTSKEKKLANSEPVGTQTAKIQQQINRHKIAKN
ncbi:hypothetical protein scyTo_0001434 [Scyliorhinus torazame]|uniref:Microtubule-actin cross-linking factor 1 n=1 Tax=Scyliorhinus torazame TaxID=75743 RepID=A0A401PD04_SCYTO|nr:hypothetical protein [Scyliorhinus torazame]